MAHALRTLNPRATIFLIHSYFPGRSSGIGGIARFSAITHNLPFVYAKMYTVAVAFFGQSQFVGTRIDKAASAESLKAFRKAQRLTQRVLADLISVEFTTYRNWEYAKAVPSTKALRELKKLGYGEPRKQVADSPLGNPVIPVGFQMGSIPYAGEVPAGEWGDPLASEEFLEVEVKFEHPRRFAAKVVGDSCYPALQQGDVTIWHYDTNPPYGSIVIAQQRDDHGCTVKELLYEDGRPILHPINPTCGAPQDGVGWGVIARLVGVLRKVDGLEKTMYMADGLRVKHFD